MVTRVKQQIRSHETKAKVVATARALFLSRGLEETTLDNIAAACDLSKGAIYHHFSSKLALIAYMFEVEAVRSLLAARRSQATPGATPDRLVAICQSWINQLKNPQTAAILLDIGPRALGVEQARRIEAKYSGMMMRIALRQTLRAQGLNVAKPHLQLASRIINSGLAEIAWARLHGLIDSALGDDWVRVLVDSQITMLRQANRQ